MSLNIRNNELGKDSGKFLEQVLRKTLLFDLNISCNRLGDEGLTYFSPVFVAEIGCTCSIQSLNLADNGFQSIAVSSLFRDLTKTTYMKTLVLDGNNIGSGD